MTINKEFSHLRLLYIEDDEGIRSVNSRILNRMFQTVYEATNGLDGLEKHEKFHPDIIITDLKMPLLDGISMVKKIREKDKKTRIIITTAFTEEQNLIDAIELDIVRYIVKPLNQRNLIPALEKAIEQFGNTKKLSLGKNITLDVENSILINKDKEFHLTKKEFLFLELLTKNAHRVVKYEEIESHIWYDEPMSIYSLRTLVGNIRKKFNLEESIQNISGMGYKMEN
ncbi:response regulator transcription factor [Halarcobacter ebronensis]|uniref:Regulator n=1 Tax=Halarcobacter ebronensis TaxID=1462615 RepID=A0A4Q1ALH4_9BACT|nr:response regulator transcription factor [Halarcobacter ebronensis]QKF83423.1 two-component system response regulator [Halarcobacter ebronensis]RXK05981.1 regulator [Halarcobacter ebronensis]